MTHTPPEHEPPHDQTPLEDPLTDHEYDGIKEYDNPIPGWWNWLFAGTVVFSLLYILFYHIGVGPSIHEQFEAETAFRLTQRFGKIGDLKPDAETILLYMNDPEWAPVGKSVYRSKCASCHGADAAGVAGPNLTDDLYIHVKKIEDIAKVVTNGANNNQMPEHGSKLHINEIVLVSSYVASLRGQNLPTVGWTADPGKKIPAWPAPPEPKADQAPEPVEPSPSGT